MFCNRMHASTPDITHQHPSYAPISSPSFLLPHKLIARLTRVKCSYRLSSSRESRFAYTYRVHYRVHAEYVSRKTLCCNDTQHICICILLSNTQSFLTTRHKCTNNCVHTFNNPHMGIIVVLCSMTVLNAFHNARPQCMWISQRF